MRQILQAAALSWFCIGAIQASRVIHDRHLSKSSGDSETITASSSSQIPLIDHNTNNQHGQIFPLPSLRQQAALQDAWTASRIAAIPELLHKHGVDAWLISQKEYAEDTVFHSLKSATQFSARRRTLSLFLANHTTSSELTYTWIDNTPTIWQNVLDVLETVNPKSIAVNVDEEIAFGSGMHAGEHELVKRMLGEKWSSRFVSIPMLAVEFIGTQPTQKLEWYRKMMGTAWTLIAEGFSAAVIVPGETTTEDVEWYLRHRLQELNLTTWFQPDVEVVRADRQGGPEPQPGVDVVGYGDLLHVDFGITGLGMNTDTQHIGYVLHPGQTMKDIPSGYLEGLGRVNRLQDIVKSQMSHSIGRTGNEILRSSLAQMRAENIEGRIYCHSIGDWGHSAGTVIGMTNLQEGVPVLGDLPLLKDTWYSIELYAETWVEELGGMVNFYQEEDVYWDEETERFEWVWGRQEEFWVVETG